MPIKGQESNYSLTASRAVQWAPVSNFKITLRLNVAQFRIFFWVLSKFCFVVFIFRVTYCESRPCMSQFTLYISSLLMSGLGAALAVAVYVVPIVNCSIILGLLCVIECPTCCILIDYFLSQFWQLCFVPFHICYIISSTSCGILLQQRLSQMKTCFICTI